MRTDKATKDESIEKFLRRATSGLMDTKDQRRLIELAKSKAKHRIFALLLLVVASSFAIFIGIMWVFQSHFSHQTSSDFARILGSILLSCSATVIIFRYGAITRKLLASSLLKHNIRPKFCLICGYSLEEIVSDHYPECNAPLVPIDQAEEIDFEDEYIFEDETEGTFDESTPAW